MLARNMLVLRNGTNLNVGRCVTGVCWVSVWKVFEVLQGQLIRVYLCVVTSGCLCWKFANHLLDDRQQRSTFLLKASSDVQSFCFLKYAGTVPSPCILTDTRSFLLYFLSPVQLEFDDDKPVRPSDSTGISASLDSVRYHLSVVV
jgi:hypothetical protein